MRASLARVVVVVARHEVATGQAVLPLLWINPLLWDEPGVGQRALRALGQPLLLGGPLLSLLLHQQLGLALADLVVAHGFISSEYATVSGQFGVLATQM